MNSENKKVIKEIMHNKELERNLPAYAGAYTDAVYGFSMIHFVLDYYTLKEVENDTCGISNDNTLDYVMNEIHTLLFEIILSQHMEKDYSDAVGKIDDIRNLLIQKMMLLTAYTDGMQLYEYILNRVEYGITKEEYKVEESSLAARVFRYLFNDNDKMVINSKIQMVTAQLPIRMTKNRFYDYLTDTLNIYNGSEASALNDFIERLRTTALLDKPKGYGEEYPEIAGFIHTLDEVDFKNLDLEGFKALMEQFAITTQHITELVSNYMRVMELVNDFYSMILTLPYENCEVDFSNTCTTMLKGIHDAFVSGGEIPDYVDDGFIRIEGVQEKLGEDIIQYESVLPDIMDVHKDIIGGIMLDKRLNGLALTSKLLSGSLFVDLNHDVEESRIADSDYILKKRDELVKELSDFFECHTKEMNRAVMASLFASMPVLFNSQDEIKEYIEYSLGHCGNSSELMACAKILDDLMAEE